QSRPEAACPDRLDPIRSGQTSELHRQANAAGARTGHLLESAKRRRRITLQIVEGVGQIVDVKTDRVAPVIWSNTARHVDHGECRLETWLTDATGARIEEIRVG